MRGVAVACFLYQYIIGGIIFLAAFVLAWRSGDYAWKRAHDRATALVVAGIFIAYLAGHLIWQVLASGGA
jgi:hypothetical protein